MKKRLALSLLLLATVIDGCATTGTPTTSGINPGEARIGAQVATLLYLRSHAVNAPLVLQRVAQVQAALDVGSPWAALQAAALDSLSDPNDALIISEILTAYVVPKLPATSGVIDKASPAGMLLQAVLDGAKAQAALWAATHPAGGGR